MKIQSLIAIVGSLLTVITPADISIYFLALPVSLFTDAICFMAFANGRFGQFTKADSSLLIMSMQVEQ